MIVPPLCTIGVYKPWLVKPFQLLPLSIEYLKLLNVYAENDSLKSSLAINVRYVFTTGIHPDGIPSIPIVQSSISIFLSNVPNGATSFTHPFVQLIADISVA